MKCSPQSSQLTYPLPHIAGNDSSIIALLCCKELRLEMQVKESDGYNLA